MGFFGRILRFAAVGIVCIAIVGGVIFLANSIHPLSEYELQATVTNTWQEKAGWDLNVTFGPSPANIRHAIIIVSCNYFLKGDQIGVLVWTDSGGQVTVANNGFTGGYINGRYEPGTFKIIGAPPGC